MPTRQHSVRPAKSSSAERKLADYKAKRDFKKTSEPTADSTAPADERLRFVIHKHAARRLHYDLRLELDGVFKSWAVTKTPSLNPADKRLAVEVEDHPLAYGDFEGVIPQGEYGGGTVQLWDRGYWEAQQESSPQTNLKRGELKFKLEGERLQGEWVLVRMRDSGNGKRHNWLLIRHRVGNAAVSKAAQKKLEQDYSVASGRSMAQIAANKGPQPTPFILAKQPTNRVKQAKRLATEKKPQRTSTQTRKTRSAPPVFIEPQLCKLVDTPPSGSDWVHELKLDGYRLQLRVYKGKATLLTRSGLDWSHKFPALVKAAGALPSCLIDGEVVALNRQGQADFAALQAALADEDTDELVFFAFDLLFNDGTDLRKESLLERKAQLRALLADAESSSLRYLEHFQGEPDDMLRAACGNEWEGLISKRADAGYASGRGAGWTKTKCRAGHEVIIGGMTTQAGQLRSLLVGVMRGGKLVYVGRVGTGFGAAVARRVLPRLRKLVSDENPFHGPTAPRREANVTWLRPEQVAEIQFAGWTGGGNVRQAAFKGLREDKPAREVQAETPVSIDALDDSKIDQPMQKAARRKRKVGAKHPASTKRNTRAQRQHSVPLDGVVLSHPDKALWPAEGDQPAVTKQMLGEYLLSVSEWMLKHIQGRPCSMMRAPDGIGGQHFFQRHAMRGSPREIGQVKVRGDRQPYLLFDSSSALVAAAQLGGIELHPWNCMPDQPEVPGRLVFDLDPAPDVAFTAVIAAAQELRARLKDLELTSFCKTTGGKGLHVVVPLSRPRGGSRQLAQQLDWPTAKLFARTLCAQMAADQPALYLINMSKAQRKGHIFLDYLRNDRTATAVAPLSPRARPGATVSMPLEWSQVKRGLDPQRFTVHNAAQWFERHRPWQDYDNAANQWSVAVRKMLSHDTGRSPPSRERSRSRAGTAVHA